jgi:serine protease Do
MTIFYIINNIFIILDFMKSTWLTKKRKGQIRLFFGISLLSFVFGLIGSGVFISLYEDILIDELNEEYEEYNEEKSPVVESKAVHTNITQMVQDRSPSVVSIVVEEEVPLFRSAPHDSFENFFFQPFGDSLFDSPSLRRQTPELDKDGKQKFEKRRQGGGTGFIIDEKNSFVLTNRHVVKSEDANYIIILSDGTELESEVVARDFLYDLAVLKIKDTKNNSLQALPIGDSNALLIGEDVIAIGYALAEFQNTVTKGVISAKERKITASDPASGASQKLEGLLQTDAAINPGNSGGPLLNLKGEVIGINTAIASGANGIGFAIPINDAKSVIKNIKEHGRIIRPFLGVRYIMLDKELAKSLNIAIDHGAFLYSNLNEQTSAVVIDSPAEKAGLRNGDVIIEVAGDAIIKENDLRSIIATKKVNEEIAFKVWRHGEVLTLEVILGDADKILKQEKK